MIVDCHCHVIAGEMTTAAVPERWRPEITRTGARQLVGFRGNVLRSVVGEFTDPAAMLDQAAAEGIDHLLLSPWIMLIPSEPEQVSLGEALDVCRTQNEALWNSAGNPLETAITAAHLAATGVMERYPGLKILLAHGGGGLHAKNG